MTQEEIDNAKRIANENYEKSREQFSKVRQQSHTLASEEWYFPNELSNKKKQKKAKKEITTYEQYKARIQEQISNPLIAFLHNDKKREYEKNRLEFQKDIRQSFSELTVKKKNRKKRKSSTVLRSLYSSLKQWEILNETIDQINLNHESKFSKEDSSRLDVYCWYCLDLKARSKDHIVPKSNQGVGLIGNKIPCCMRCQEIKSNFTLEKTLEMLITPESSNALGQELKSRTTIIKVKKLQPHVIETMISQVKKLIEYHDKILLPQIL